jgi:hypothetical protein
MYSQVDILCRDTRFHKRPSMLQHLSGQLAGGTHALNALSSNTGSNMGSAGQQ